MVRKIYLLLTGIMAITHAFAQQALSPKTSPFTEVSIIGNFDVELVQGAKEAIKLESENVDLSKVSISHSGKKLKIKASKMLFSNRRNIQLKITYVQLNSINLNGGAKLYAADTIKSESLKLLCRNGATIDAKTIANNLFVRMGQGGVITLDGNCSNLKVEATNGAIFNAYGLTSDNADLLSNSGAIVKVGKSKNIVASAVLGGQISYRGNPQLTVKRTTFGASIEQMIE